MPNGRGRTVAMTATNPYFRSFVNTDVIGTEFAGVLKNLIAVAIGIVSNRARMGVTPTPPAIRSTFRRVRRAAVIAPYGPSGKTQVPGLSSCTLALPLPRFLTVSRRCVLVGGADSENGWADRQS